MKRMMLISYSGTLDGLVNYLDRKEKEKSKNEKARD